MPFRYNIPVPELPAADDGETILLEWLQAANTWVEMGDPIARVRRGAREYDILVNGPGILAEHRRSIGATIRGGELLAIMHADGESIPYGKPYSLARAT